MKFRNYYQVRDWIEQFIPQTYTRKELGLERVSYLLKLLGNPEKKFKSILIKRKPLMCFSLARRGLARLKDYCIDDFSKFSEGTERCR